jgi:hypothetical protein
VEQLEGAEAIASLIKAWFASLPDSVLLPVLETVIDGPPEGSTDCYAVVERLPALNRAVIEWLLQLICDVARHEETNRMTVQSLVIVFAPNVVDPPPTFPPLLGLELNRRVVLFLERAFDEWARRQSV